MVDNVSCHQLLLWEIMFFVKKICYNLTVYVTLYYTLANIDPYLLIVGSLLLLLRSSGHLLRGVTAIVHNSTCVICSGVDGVLLTFS